MSISVPKGRGMHIIVYWLIVMLAVVIDQVTKATAVEVLMDGPKTLVEGVINLVHVENTGAAFSIGQGGNLFFIGIAIVFIAACTYVVWSEEDLPYPFVCSIALVAGGGFGNMIDRVMSGSVTDFIATAFIDFPVFNFADIFVTVGIAWTVLNWWLYESKRSTMEQDVEADLTNDGRRHAS